MITVPKWLTAIAIAGFFLSAAVHVMVILGYAPVGAIVVLLHVGVFIVMFPTVALQLKIQLAERDWITAGWDTILPGIPIWLRCLCVVLFAYIFFSASGEHFLGMTPQIWMCFYCAGGSVIYSIYRRPWPLLGLFCPNGHKGSYVNRFCPTCGTCLPKGPTNA